MITFLYTADCIGYSFYEFNHLYEYQQLCMKLESLFIDEGFGSLDSAIPNIINDK